MAHLLIKPCTIHEVPTLAAVAVQAYLEVYPYLWQDGGKWYIERSFSQSVLENDLRQPNQAWFLLQEEGNTVGYLKLNISNTLEGFEQYDCLELERIYIIKSANGKGYGRRAVEFSEAFARARNKDIIWLRSMDSTTFPAFYEKLGFNICGTYRLDFELMKDELRGMVVMMKWLKE